MVLCSVKQGAAIYPLIKKLSCMHSVDYPVLSCPVLSGFDDVMLRIRARQCQRIELSWVSSAASRRYNMMWHHPPEPMACAVSHRPCRQWSFSSVQGDDLLIELGPTHLAASRASNSHVLSGLLCVCVWSDTLLSVCFVPAVELTEKLTGHLCQSRISQSISRPTPNLATMATRQHPLRELGWSPLSND